MVYKKKVVTYRKKRYIPRKKGGFSNMTIGQIASSAWKGVQYMKGLINSELLYSDANPIAGTVNTTGVIGLVNGIAIGDSPITRTGNSVLNVSCALNGYITWSTINSTQNIALWLIQDTQQVADTPPAFGTIFSGSDVQVFMNRDAAGRFKVLKKWTFEQDTSKPQIVFSYYYEFPRGTVHTKYNGSASSDIQKNGLYIVAVSNQAATSLPTLNVKTRFSYHDN